MRPVNCSLKRTSRRLSETGRCGIAELVSGTIGTFLPVGIPQIHLEQDAVAAIASLVVQKARGLSARKDVSGLTFRNGDRHADTSW